MKRILPVMLTVVLMLALAGSSEAKKPKAPPPNPTHPAKAATHTVILQKVQLSDFDFTRDPMGEPRSLAIEITEDGNLIAPTSGDTVLQGIRGERMLQTPVQWLINFNPQKNYQVILTEQVEAGAPTGGKRITTPATPTMGYWPFAEVAGKIPVSKDSYLQFIDKVQ